MFRENINYSEASIQVIENIGLKTKKLRPSTEHYVVASELTV